MGYKDKRTHRMRVTGPIYVARGPRGDLGWPFRHKRPALIEARLRSVGQRPWTVMRYGSRHDQF